MSRAPGSVRDSIISYLESAGTASVAEIQAAVAAHLGTVAPSSVRSYLNLNTPGLFLRNEPGHYRLKNGHDKPSDTVVDQGEKIGKAHLVEADCFHWLATVRERSLHAVVTDPPYGGIEYTHKEQSKLRDGNKGGVWRIPPSFDGHQRSPLPRFTVLRNDDRDALRLFFRDFGKLLLRATVPGANIVIASNPLLVHLVADAMASCGLEPRGYISRLVMTMRGGDRPKNAEKDFPDVSVMPRSMFEPWLVLRHPLDGRVQDNLRKWKTGGFRRLSDERPFGDVIKSSPTPKREKDIAPHPSLKPQAFLRAVVRASLPLGEGVVCDPFAGSGSTLAAANAVGYDSVGVESDPAFVKMAKRAIPKLAGLAIDPVVPELFDALPVQRRGGSAKIAARVTAKVRNGHAK
jgi:DNA modification methylase